MASMCLGSVGVSDGLRAQVQATTTSEVVKGRVSLSLSPAAAAAALWDVDRTFPLVLARSLHGEARFFFSLGSACKSGRSDTFLFFSFVVMVIEALAFYQPMAL